MRLCLVATLISVFSWFSSPRAMGMVPPIVSLGKKIDRYLSQGAFIGGTQGRNLSLLAIQWHARTRDLGERIRLTMGEADGEELSGPLGYYHVEVSSDPPRISIDFAQTQRTRLDENAIRQALSSSKLISSIDFTMDPEDISTNLTIKMKKPVALEVFHQGRGAHAAVVLDYYPLSRGD